jgi:hypothetical protein
MVDTRIRGRSRPSPAVSGKRIFATAFVIVGKSLTAIGVVTVNYLAPHCQGCAVSGQVLPAKIKRKSSQLGICHRR